MVFFTMPEIARSDLFGILVLPGMFLSLIQRKDRKCAAQRAIETCQKILPQFTLSLEHRNVNCSTMAESSPEALETSSAFTYLTDLAME